MVTQRGNHTLTHRCCQGGSQGLNSVGYIFEPYRLNDFQWNGLNAYPIDGLPAEQQFPTTRPLLLDSRYSSHNAHVFGVYLRFSKGKNAGTP